MKLEKLLKLLRKNDLISEDQANNIKTFMKEREKEIFFRFIKWIMIIGAFWLVAGVISTIINILELNIFSKIWLYLTKVFTSITALIQTYIFTPIYHYILMPIGAIVYKFFGDNQAYFYWGIATLCVSILLLFIDNKIKPKKEIEKLNLSDEQKNILRTNWTLNTCSAILLAATFCLFNMLLIPVDHYESTDKILPIWNIVGAITFTSLAYKFKKNIYLIFGIYFIALSIGTFNGYDCACYWLHISRPITQILFGIILLGLAHITELKSNIENLKDDNTSTYIKDKFAETYSWTGLLFIFTALWVSSMLGFEFEISSEGLFIIETLFANVLLIAASIGAILVGSKTEKQVYFNYGLTFLIIETYTFVLCRLLLVLPMGINCLLIGALLIGTGKIIQKVYLTKHKEQ